jgi:hypothetical protein
MEHYHAQHVQASRRRPRLLGATATAQETSTSHSDGNTPQMAPGQSMMGHGDMPGLMGQGGMMGMMQMMGPMMEQCSEMMAAMASQMPSAPSAPGSPDDNG